MRTVGPHYDAHAAAPATAIGHARITAAPHLSAHVAVLLCYTVDRERFARLAVISGVGAWNEPGKRLGCRWSMLEDFVPADPARPIEPADFTFTPPAPRPVPAAPARRYTEMWGGPIARARWLGMVGVSGRMSPRNEVDDVTYADLRTSMTDHRTGFGIAIGIPVECMDRNGSPSVSWLRKRRALRGLTSHPEEH